MYLLAVETVSADCKIFDQQDFVALFAVHQLVHKLPRHHDTETARTQSLRLTVGQMPGRVIGRSRRSAGSDHLLNDQLTPVENP